MQVMATRFVPGLELARRFYWQAVRPILDRHLPDLPHTAALVGTGSEVLGFDTERSTDHNWGPRLQLFLDHDDARQHSGRISGLLSDHLPVTFLGYPTNIEPVGGRDRAMRHTDGPVHHAVTIAELGDWLVNHLGFTPLHDLTAADWLACPTQRLAELTGGAVFHDGLARLEPVRQRLAWYPDDLWRHVLACQWLRISQEEAFVGRCGHVDDELGSAVIAARLIRDLMRLCLLMARRYPPYAKWLGSAFTQLPIADTTAPTLAAALAATDWREREQRLATAYEAIATAHNALGLTDPVDPTTRPYHTRPYRVLHAERFTAALLDTITDPAVRALPLIGGVDQYVDSTDVLTDPVLTRAVAATATSAASRGWDGVP